VNNRFSQMFDPRGLESAFFEIWALISGLKYNTRRKHAKIGSTQARWPLLTPAKAAATQF